MRLFFYVFLFFFFNFLKIHSISVIVKDELLEEHAQVSSSQYLLTGRFY